jgi:hypothetical protein
MASKLKKIPDSLVDSFVKEVIAFERQALKVAALKAKLRNLASAGAENSMLRFEDNVSWRPPWKKLVTELTEQYMTVGQRAVYRNKLKKRFKPTNGAKKITILAPRYVAFQDKVVTLKQQLGLVKEEVV